MTPRMKAKAINTFTLALVQIDVDFSGNATAIYRSTPIRTAHQLDACKVYQ